MGWLMGTYLVGGSGVEGEDADGSHVRISGLQNCRTMHSSFL